MLIVEVHGVERLALAFGRRVSRCEEVALARLCTSHSYQALPQTQAHFFDSWRLLHVFHQVQAENVMMSKAFLLAGAAVAQARHM